MSTLYDEVMKKEDREEEEHEDRDVQKRHKFWRFTCLIKI
jgi:hypothetical protein